ncbi:MAG TPA: hypothetical protein VGS41_12065, partial [Chthonomonadales bacterium]|nr:hypothetical protein [Chthonomonadales bacterium]
AYVQERLIAETHHQRRALRFLGDASRIGAGPAMRLAEEELMKAVTSPVATDLKERVSELAEALFQTIQMQLSVPKYQAIAVDRGANLDMIDAPLNDRIWLMGRFNDILDLPDEIAKLKEIRKIVEWKNPGPGGYYDEPGDPLNRAHLVTGPGFAADTGCYRSARTGFSDFTGIGRLGWTRHAETLYDTPLCMRYTNLDPQTRYRVRYVMGDDDPSYGSENPNDHIRLVAANGTEIHPPLPKPVPVRPLEFDIPPEAVEGGILELHWVAAMGRGGNGRGCQLSEVWLIKQPEAQADNQALI